MTQSEFEDALRILKSIDRYELVAAEVISADDCETWPRFRADPYRSLIRMDDATADRVWSIVERRLSGCHPADA